MTEIKVIAKNSLNLSPSIKRLEVFSDGSVGTFEMFFDDAGAVSQPAQCANGDFISEISVDGHEVMRGYIDDVKKENANPRAASKDRYASITGRNVARDLSRLFLTYNFTNTRLGDLFSNALELMNSQIIVPNSYKGTGPLISIEVKDMYLIELFEEVAQKAGYGYTVNWYTNPPNLIFWPLNNTPHTNVTLKTPAPTDPTGNILLIHPNADLSSSVCNVIKMKAGSVNDHWTENTAAQWSVANGSLTNDTSVRRIGDVSLRVDYTTGGLKPELHLKFPAFYYQYLDYSNILVDTCSVFLMHSERSSLLNGSVTVACSVYLKDSNDSVMRWRLRNNLSSDKWVKKTFVMGVNAPVSSTEAQFSESEEWYIVNGSGFNWKIVDFWFTQEPESGHQPNASLWVDGLEFPAIDVFAMAYDQDSIDRYGMSMMPLYRPDLPNNMISLQQAADEELALRKDSFERLHITCTFQPNILYAGLTVDVLAAEYDIVEGVNGAVRYRVENIRHIVEPGVALCRGHDAITVLELVKHNNGQRVNATRTRQASNHQNAVNVSHEGRLRRLEEYSQAVGGSSSGGGGGSSFDGGILTLPLEIKNLFPFIDESKDQMYNWLWGYYRPDPQNYLRFANTEEGKQHWIDLYGVMVSNGVDEGPGLGLTGHFVCAKDIVCRGMLSSYEGVVALQGNKNAGWAPTINPLIWLSKGGIYGNCNTLEIRKVDGTTGSGFVWGWGNIESNSVTSHGSVNTSHLRSMNGTDFIALYSNIEPYTNGLIDLGSFGRAFHEIFVQYAEAGYVTAQSVYTDSIGSASNTDLIIHPYAGRTLIIDGNVKVTGTFTGPAANPFNQNLNTFNAVTFNDITNTGSETVWGDIICHGWLAVTHIAADNHPFNSIAIYDHMIPARMNNGNSLNPGLGLASNPWEWCYANIFMHKLDDQSFCERSQSGTVVNHQIQTEDDALEALTHEITKTVRHITYSTENPDEIICTCGKSTLHPCPEHRDTWRDKYTKNITRQNEASGFLLIEHAVSIDRLKMALLEETEKNAALEQRLSLLEQKLTKQTEVIRND
ncbi:MAG: hypothetical protein FWG55_05820 [Candidatus Bathyarchaeota archaeon]|nr:hypothetical protein [Candidatus Termiticorpusculum sp.]